MKVLPHEEGVTAEQIVNDARRILRKFHGEECTFLNRMALLWIVAKYHQLSEVPRGMFIDLALDMWELANACEEKEPKKREGN